ncbi:Fbxl13 [Phodopus roborovskii]|uniref:Fbxl13 protein n=1 Tax=Phodopus roborovskii TaxID=109678 RepID=A0AAV0AE27_PHORO|nr:Fbxl13 [Phodopus roborovskii]
MLSAGFAIGDHIIDKHLQRYCKSCVFYVGDGWKTILLLWLGWAWLLTVSGLALWCSAALQKQRRIKMAAVTKTKKWVWGYGLVSHCKNLQELNVSDCQFLTDESMRHISEGCPGVLYLNLSNTTITNRTMRLLPRYFHNLQNLSLAYCRKFTDKGLQYLNLGNGCHKLIYLDLSGCTQVLVEKCPRISTVVFIGSPHISDCAFKALSSCNLKKIRFEGNKRITDACFKYIDKNYPGINHIYMVDCRALTDSSLKSLSVLKQLTVLNLTNCVRISDIGLRQFLDGPASVRIRELNLTNCMLLGDSSIVRLSERCPNLHYLSLRNCEHLTDLAIEYIASMLSLISIDLSGTPISNEASN